jgi:hypothetical protein
MTELMLDKIRTNQAKIEAINGKFEFSRSALVSRVNIHHTKTETMEEDTDANLKEIKSGQEHLEEEQLST